MRAKALGLFVLLCGHLVGLSVGNKAGSSENTTLLQNAGVLRTGEQQLFGRAEPGPGNEADSVGLISPAQVENQVAPFVKEFRRVIKKNEICWKATFSQSARAILEASPWKLRFRSKHQACLAAKRFTKEKPRRPDPVKWRVQPGLQISEDYNAPSALRTLSNGYKRKAQLDGRNPYAYYTKAGEGISVYVLDYGAGYELTSSDYRLEPRWLRRFDEQLIFKDHAAQVAHAIASKQGGVAKNAQIVVLPIAPDKHGRLQELAIIQAFEEIFQDVEAKRLKGKAVINMSLNVHNSDNPEIFFHNLKDVLRRAADLGIVLVTVAGNDGPCKVMHNMFAQVGYTTDIPLIIVGLLDERQQRSRSSQGWLESHVWAPGDLNWHTGIQFPGTSFSAARVSGLAAYFLSTVDFDGEIKDRAQLVKDYIIDQARRESKYGPLIANNGIGAHFSPDSSIRRFLPKWLCFQSCQLSGDR